MSVDDVVEAVASPALVAVPRQLSRAGDAGGWQRIYVRVLLASDAAAGLVVMSAAVLLSWLPQQAGRHAGTWPWAPAVLVLLWVVTVSLWRAYEPRFLGVGSEEYRRVAMAGLTLLAAAASAAWALGLSVGQGAVVAAIPAVTLLALVQRYAIRKSLHSRRNLGACTMRVLVVGHADGIEELVRLLRSARYHGLDVVAACSPEQDSALGCLGVPVVGGFDDIVVSVRRLRIDVVAVLSSPEMDGPAMRRLGWALEGTDAQLVVAPPIMETVGPRIAIRPVCGLPLLSVDRPELAGIRRIAKSAVDRAFALCALLLLWPLLVGIALAIRIDSRGPVLFRQQRVGKGGVPFTLLKFRTMVPDAETQRQDLSGFNEGNGVLFKVRQDPRVTRVGRFLRRYSLDELPQLLNVLSGRMSLVGPRPPLPDEVARYPHHVHRRLLVKPGLTGLWQINGRSDLDWEESVRLDLRYVENWSFAFDLLILWKTAGAVLRGTGAY